MPGNDLSIQQLQQQVRDLIKGEKQACERLGKLETKEETAEKRADKFEADIDGHEGRVLKSENTLKSYAIWIARISKFIVYAGGACFAVFKLLWSK